MGTKPGWVRACQMRAMEIVVHGVPAVGQEVVAVHIVDVAVAVVVHAVPGYLQGRPLSKILHNS